MDMETIRSLNEEIFEVTSRKFHFSLQTFSDNNIPNVGCAMMMFVAKANIIKSSLFEICENEDIYSANILFRALIDHHLRFMYIFTRYVKERNDCVGVEYYKFCDLMESLSVGRSWLESWQLLEDGNEAKLREALLEKQPDLKNIPINEIIRKAKQFNYRSIVRFIKDSIENLDYGWLDLLIPHYGNLSSYVHGGPLAEKSLFYSLNSHVQKETLNIAKLSFIAANTITQFYYLTLTLLDKGQHSKSLEEIDKIMHQFYLCRD